MIIDGKKISEEVKAEIAQEANAFLEKYGRKPGLAVVIIGENPASRTYVNSKKKACEQFGFYSKEYSLDENVSQEELIALIEMLNKAEDIDGILVQLPLPKHIDEKSVIAAIIPQKDVDGFHPVNIGNLVVGGTCFVPCTPFGIMELLKRSNVDIEGKNAVVVGRSNIVGKPISLLLLEKNATVTMCHSKTVDLPEICRKADILIAAVGRAEMIKGDWIKPGATVIDVGINRVEGKKLLGDVEFESASKVAGHITPVPGGVGPMTITMLLKNTLDAAYALKG